MILKFNRWILKLKFYHYSKYNKINAKKKGWLPNYKEISNINIQFSKKTFVLSSHFQFEIFNAIFNIVVNILN